MARSFLSTRQVTWGRRGRERTESVDVGGQGLGNDWKGLVRRGRSRGKLHNKSCCLFVYLNEMNIGLDLHTKTNHNKLYCSSKNSEEQFVSYANKLLFHSHCLCYMKHSFSISKYVLLESTCGHDPLKRKNMFQSL